MYSGAGHLAETPPRASAGGISTAKGLGFASGSESWAEMWRHKQHVDVNSRKVFLVNKNLLIGLAARGMP